MANWPVFNATNVVSSCLYCGKHLAAQVMGTTLRVDESDPPPPAQVIESRPSVDGHVRFVTYQTGRFGYNGDDFFCSLRCGYVFGRTLADHGRRLEPKVQT